MESTLTTSPPKRSQASSANALLPTAVGPTTTRTTVRPAASATGSSSALVALLVAVPVDGLGEMVLAEHPGVRHLRAAFRAPFRADHRLAARHVRHPRA